MNRLRCITILFAAFLTVPAHADDTFTPMWARQSYGLTSAGLDGQGLATVDSPDKRFELQLHAGRFELLEGDAPILDLSELIGSVFLTEIMWAPDSKAFFINASDGGQVGTWKTYVFVNSGGKFSEVDVASLIGSHSKLTTTCEHKNIGAVVWRNGHRDLVLLEQVPNISYCSNMDAVAGYVLDLDQRKTLEVLDKRVTQRRYRSYLGDDARSLVNSQP